MSYWILYIYTAFSRNFLMFSKKVTRQMPMEKKYNYMYLISNLRNLLIKDINLDEIINV